MRYRHLSYRYAIVVYSPQAWPFGDIGKSDRLRLLGPARWRPDADMYETATKVEVVVDLAGVAEDDFEIQLFEDALIIEGHRQLPTCEEGAVYHAAGIHQGPFRIELPLPALVNAKHVEPRYERGLLRITLPKRAETG